MLSHDHLLPHAIGYLLVLCRISGLFLLTPILSGETVPRRVKAAFIVVLAGVVYPTIDHARYSQVPLELWSLAPVVASELAIGAAIGFMALIPIMSVQLAGLVMGQQLGLALAEQFNPALNISAENFGQLLFMTTIASFIWIGGLEFVFASAVLTFDALPAGSFPWSATPVDLLSGLVASGFVVAIQISMPVLAIILLETIAMGFVMRTVPALNVLSVGFPLRILAGTMAFVGGLIAMKHTIIVDLQRVFAEIERWVLSLSDLGVAGG